MCVRVCESSDLPAPEKKRMRGLRGADEARDAPVPWMPDEVGGRRPGRWGRVRRRGWGGAEWPLGSRHTDILGPHSIRPSQLCNELLRIQAHFNDVVEEGEHRCQRKGGHEEGYKAKLDDYERAWHERRRGLGGFCPAALASVSSDPDLLSSLGSDSLSGVPHSGAVSLSTCRPRGQCYHLGARLCLGEKT